MIARNLFVFSTWFLSWLFDELKTAGLGISYNQDASGWCLVATFDSQLRVNARLRNFKPAIPLVLHEVLTRLLLSCIILISPDKLG